MSQSLQDASGGTRLWGNFTLTGLSGAATTYSSTATPFSISGKMYTKAAVSGGTTPTTDGNTGSAMTLVANQAAAFVWALDTSSGTVKVYKGATQTYTDTSALSTPCPLPTLPDTVAPAAVVVIKAGATTSGTWTFGSSNWNATGIVIDTVVNLAGNPNFVPVTA